MKLHEILTELNTTPDEPTDDGQPGDSEQDSLDIGTRTVNVGGEFKHPQKGGNRKKAERIQQFARKKSKDANPQATDTPTGWRAGSYKSSVGMDNWRFTQS